MSTPEPYGNPLPPAGPAPYAGPLPPADPYGHGPEIHGQPAHARPRRLRPVHLAVAAGSLLAGVAVAVAVLLLAGWRYLPVNDYEVRVFLDATASAEQIEAVRAGLSESSGDGGARARTPEESYADLQKTYAATGDTVPPSVTAQSLPRMVVAEISGRDFDCDPYTAVKGLAGVDSVRIGQYDDGTPIAATEC